MLQILHFSLHVSFISHDSEAISNSKYNTVQSDHEELHLSDLLFIPYNVKNPFSSLPIDFNTRLLHQSILGGLVVGKHTNSSPESQTNSTLLGIFQWPLLAVSKASHFICGCLSQSSTPWEWQALARLIDSEVSHCLWGHTGLKDKEDSGAGSYCSYVCYMASYFGFA